MRFEKVWKGSKNNYVPSVFIEIESYQSRNILKTKKFQVKYPLTMVQTTSTSMP